MRYQTGFGNEFETEAVAGALPKGQNSPQKCPLGLYAEQLSGTAFTAPPGQNKRSWLYKLRPSVVFTGEFKKLTKHLLRTAPCRETETPPEPFRWNPVPAPSSPLTDFIDGLTTWCVAGNAENALGMAAHAYCANRSMTDRFFYNTDGEMLVVPQQGELRFKTEFGILEVKPGEIVIIPRGVKFQVELMQSDSAARGYICENYGRLFEIPGKGPIGANGLASARDFEAPVASYEDRSGPFELVVKFRGALWSTAIAHSPLDVVAWHGNYTPFKYDLARFNTINTVSFDHPDPSIFTVLTSPSSDAGTANIDFVIFPPRWMVAENTFRPPYFHRNVMSEFMGLIHGVYDAKADGFVPGGASVHNAMTGHGPDVKTFDDASNTELKPVYQGGTLAFMFETRYVFDLTKWGYDSETRQCGYASCWAGLKSGFKIPQ